jgi:glycosyltransferase involved in cell wall biosynthesis
MVGDGLAGAVVPVGDVPALAAALESIRRRVHAGEDFESASAARVASASFTAAAEGLAAACRAVTAGDAPPPPAAVRTIVSCTGMVIAGGLERMTFEVLRALRQRGAAVHCVVNDWENHRIVALADEVGASWSEGIHRVTIERTLHPIKIASIVWDTLRASARLVSDACRFRATHVLLPDYVSALHNAPAIALLRVIGVKIVMRLGNAPEPGRFYRFVWRAIVGPLTGQFVPNSKFTERALLAYGVPARKVRRIYNPVATRSRAAEAAPPQREAGRLIFIGQMIPDKGVDVLLDAVALLVRRGYGHVRLDLVGDLDGWGPAYTGYREQLRARAQQADLARRVRFLGWREDVPALLAGASIHCCPSMPAMRESFANVVVEAKAAGIPSVVLPTGSLAELVDHRVDGWVCDACTPESLADGLEFFLSDEPRREAAGRQARRSTDRFGWDQFATAWWSVFTELPAAPELTPTTHPGASSA